MSAVELIKRRKYNKLRRMLQIKKPSWYVFRAFGCGDRFDPISIEIVIEYLGPHFSKKMLLDILSLDGTHERLLMVYNVLIGYNALYKLYGEVGIEGINLSRIPISYFYNLFHYIVRFENWVTNQILYSIKLDFYELSKYITGFEFYEYNPILGKYLAKNNLEYDGAWLLTNLHNFNEAFILYLIDKQIITYSQLYNHKVRLEYNEIHKFNLETILKMWPDACRNCKYNYVKTADINIFKFEIYRIYESKKIKFIIQPTLLKKIIEDKCILPFKYPSWDINVRNWKLTFVRIFVVRRNIELIAQLKYQ